MEQWMHYASQIKQQVNEILDENEESSNSIDLAQLQENNNVAHFLHAFTVVGALYYKQLTGKEIDYLEFNHIANRLCFQFTEKDK